MLEPALCHTLSRHTSNALVLLWHFLPHSTGLQDLAPGTFARWMAVWSEVDNCPAWDGTWMEIVHRLLKHSHFGSAGGDAAAGDAVGFDIAPYLPFIFSRVQVR
jgi:hypothetical protein